MNSETHHTAADHHEMASKAHRSAAESCGHCSEDAAAKLAKTAHEHSVAAHEASKQAIMKPASKPAPDRYQAEFAQHHPNAQPGSAQPSK